MVMTRKHYKRTAEILARTNTPHSAVEEIADMFAADNPRFKKDMFYAYFMECELLNYLKGQD